MICQQKGESASSTGITCAPDYSARVLVILAFAFRSTARRHSPVHGVLQHSGGMLCYKYCAAESSGQQVQSDSG